MVNPYFKAGDWNATCDVCGCEFKASYLRKRDDGMRVCKRDFEAEHPSDSFRAGRGEKSLPWARSDEIASRGLPYVDEIYVEGSYTGYE